MKNKLPIGIFDSGIGGMTVARAITDLLPNEKIIYFGDTAHLPYGDKSTEVIKQYSISITKFLLEKGCKVIVIACNSASAAAFEDVSKLAEGKAIVVNVIDPVVSYVEENYSNITLGLIGTKQTINSNVYKSKVDLINKNIELKSLATPLLAHLIEEGFHHNKISEDVISEYLSNEKLNDIEGLILGCTHYPLIKREISKYYSNKLDILDSAKIVATELAQILEVGSLQNKEKYEGNQHHFYVSDFTKSFEESTKIFFGEQIKLEHFPLWKQKVFPE